MIGIYKITNPKGKVYIGQSIDIESRKKNYTYSRCKNQTKLFNSIEKYGWSNHSFSIIEECIINQLNTQERYWQDYYNVLEEGLNCMLTTTIDKSGKLSLKTKNKISGSSKGVSRNKGIPKSEEHRAKLSIAVKQRVYTPERLNNMKKSMVGKNTRSIICTTTNEIFTSIKKCANKYKINPESIGNILRGRAKSTREGYKFNYIN